MQTNAKIATALVGGYLLGRTKKAKMAIGLGMFLAGKKINLDPKELSRMAAGSPLVSGLSDQVRKDLVDGGRTALTSAVTERANSLADTLHERTLDLNDPDRRSDREAGSEEDRDTEAEPEAEADTEAEPEADGDRRAERGGDRRTGARRESTGRKPSANPDGKPAAKPAAKSASTARRSSGKAASTARRTTGSARKTASSGGRGKSSDRGDADG